MFSRLIKQLSGNEDVTEALKVKNQMLWRQKMNNPRNAAMEIISHMTVDYFKLIRYNEKLVKEMMYADEVGLWHKRSCITQRSIFKTAPG